MKPDKPRILVVEDEGIVAQDIQMTLERLGYDVPAAVACGEEALEKTGQMRPDLVLMDIMLDGKMDGVEAASRIQEQLHTPVVYLTAHTDTTTLRRATQTNPYGYIVKPLVERDLHATIEVALQKYQADAQTLEREQWLARVLVSLGEALIVTDQDGVIRFFNPLAGTLTGWERTNAIGRHLKEVLVLTGPALTENGDGIIGQVLLKGLVMDCTGSTLLAPCRGQPIPVDFTAARLRHEDGQSAGVVIAIRDVTPRKQSEEDRERLIDALQDAIKETKTLDGIIPICASCKKIRDEQGSWEQMESYITKRTSARFSHSICPDCIEIYYSGPRR